MSLLDDARRLLEPAADCDGRLVYVYCGGSVATGHHAPCDLAAVPQIVAALEAAEGVVEAFEQAPRSGVLLDDAIGELVDALRDEVQAG